MNRLLRIGVFILGAAVLVGLIVHSGPTTLWRTITDSVWVVGPLILLWGLVYACNARAWQLLIPNRPPEFTFWRAYLITISSFALNFATPALSLGGEPLKMATAAPFLGRERAVGSVVSFRFLHAISHVLVLLSAVVPAAILLPHSLAVVGLLVVATSILSAAAIFLLSRHRGGIFERGMALVARFRVLRPLSVRLEKRRSWLQELDRELSAVHGAPGQFTWALASEVSARLLSNLETTIIFYGLGLGVDFPRAYVVANLASLFTMAMFFMPFEMGAKEGGTYIVFSWLGLDPALGTSAALLSRVREVTWTAIGLLVLLAIGPTKTNKSSRVLSPS